MRHVTKTHALPSDSMMHRYCKRIDYCDSFGCVFSPVMSIDEITEKIFSTPSWTDTLMKVRDFMVKPLGLQTSRQIIERKERETDQIKHRLPFNLVEMSANEIVMHEKDRHLNFWVSVMTAGNVVYLTTVVEYNNVWGRLYFAVVKPFHTMIIRSTLNSIKN